MTTVVIPQWFAIVATVLWGAKTVQEGVRIYQRWRVNKRISQQISDIVERHGE